MTRFYFLQEKLISKPIFLDTTERNERRTETKKVKSKVSMAFRVKKYIFK